MADLPITQYGGRGLLGSKMILDLTYLAGDTRNMWKNARLKASKDLNPISSAVSSIDLPPSSFLLATTMRSRFIHVFGDNPISRIKAA